MKTYNKANIPLAKQLRKAMTPWERKLWYEYLRYYPLRFQRQKAIGEYIVDFYCAKAQLVVELDGGGHYEPQQQRLDEQRTAVLEKMGLRVIRICNLDIDKNFPGVCAYIDEAVRQSLPQSPTVTAPSSEGADEGRKAVKTIYALGVFDGVHLGHQALLKVCRELADQYGCKAGALTFTSHPDGLVRGESPRLLNTVSDRCLLLHGYGIETVIKLPFDRELMNTHWSAFLSGLVEQGAAGFVCGSGFRFGAGGSGTAKKLEAFCKKRELACGVVPQQELDGLRISSTYIRELIAGGNVEEAGRFLGHPHILTGEVVSGRKLGRTLGIPTANLLIPEGVVCPRHGVYACKAIVGEAEYLAVTNVGSRPTVGGHRVTVEPWLLDFEGDLYGKTVTLAFYRFLRPEKKFDSLESLKAEIQENALQTRKFFEKT